MTKERKAATIGHEATTTGRKAAVREHNTTTRESVKPVMGITLSLVVYPATISTNLLMTSSRIMMTSSDLLMTSSNLLMTSSGSCLLIRALVTFDT